MGQRPWFGVLFNSVLTRRWRRDRPGEFRGGTAGCILMVISLAGFLLLWRWAEDPEVDGALGMQAEAYALALGCVLLVLLVSLREVFLRRHVRRMLRGETQLMCSRCGYPWRHGGEHQEEGATDRPGCPECGTPRPASVEDFAR